MKLFARLLWLQINQRFGLSALKAAWRDERKKTLGRGALALIVIISIAMLVVMYTWLLAAMMPGFESLGMEWVVLSIALLAGMVFVFFMGLIYLIGMLFFAKDTEFLAALPIPQRTVFAAKFGQVLLGEIGTSALLLLPAFIVFGVSTGANALFYLRCLPVLLFAPCIPLALSGLLALLLMRFNALWRRRDLLTVIGSILMVVVIMVGQMALTSSVPEDLSNEAIMALISDNSGLLHTIATAFPPSGWAAEGLVSGGGSLWLFLIVSVLALCLVTLVSGRIYYGGAMAQLETASEKRKVAINERTARRAGALKALFLREWRTVLRTPVYALNGLIIVIMGPLLMLIPLMMQGMASGDEMEAVFSLLQSAADGRITVLVLAALFCIIGMISPATTTSLSREGKLYYLLRMVPVTPARQAAAKFLFGYSVAGLTMLMMGLAASLGLGVSPVVMIEGIALGMLATIAPLALSMLPDFIKPKLQWNSETEAIKQNMNGMLGMLIGWVYVFGAAFGCYRAIRGGWQLSNVLGIVIALSAVLGAVALWVLCKTANRSWRAIEG